MKRRGARLVVLCGLLAAAAGGMAAAAAGRFLPPEEFPSAALGAARTVRIWLPPSYDGEPGRRYAVLYLHDGQNVLSSAGREAAFGWGSWEVDRAVERLAGAGRMREVILVGVDNTPARYQEYRGRAARYTADERQAAPFVVEEGDNAAYARYARFLAEELKPAMDRRFRTRAGPADTGVLGSSMGGLCSLALAWDRPDVFGLAGSLSGSFQVEKRHFLEKVLRAHAGGPKPVRLYLDSGIRSPGGDDGRANTTAVAAELRRIGWRDGTDLRHETDDRLLTAAELEALGLPAGKVREAQASQHNELYWRLRVERALEFLFPPEPAG